ncbi:MAG: DsbA family protein [Polyangiales bacterium]
MVKTDMDRNVFFSWSGLALSVLVGLTGGGLVACGAAARTGVARDGGPHAADSARQPSSAKARSEPAKAAEELPPLPLYADVPRVRVPVGNSPERGSEQPLVVLVQFSDFQCPFCALVVPTLDRLLETYGEKLQLRFRHNPMPFHEHAALAAQACHAARMQQGDKGFWQMHDRLFAHQDALTEPDLVRHAAAIGLDQARFDRDLHSDAAREAVRRDQQVALSLQAMGTPWHFINGRSVTGAMPYAEFDQVVRQEIELAEHLLADGVTREDLYARVLARAAKQVMP